MSLILIATRIHAATIQREGLANAEIDLSVREALRLQRRVNEVAAMSDQERDYFEGHIKPEPHVRGCRCLECR